MSTLQATSDTVHPITSGVQRLKLVGVTVYATLITAQLSTYLYYATSIMVW